MEIIMEHQEMFLSLFKGDFWSKSKISIEFHEVETVFKYYLKCTFKAFIGYCDPNETISPRFCRKRNDKRR